MRAGHGGPKRVSAILSTTRTIKKPPTELLDDPFLRKPVTNGRRVTVARDARERGSERVEGVEHVGGREVTGVDDQRRVLDGVAEVVGQPRVGVTVRVRQRHQHTPREATGANKRSAQSAGYCSDKRCSAKTLTSMKAPGGYAPATRCGPRPAACGPCIVGVRVADHRESFPLPSSRRSRRERPFQSRPAWNAASGGPKGAARSGHPGRRKHRNERSE